jgi:hypothetical protein
MELNISSVTCGAYEAFSVQYNFTRRMRQKSLPPRGCVYTRSIKGQFLSMWEGEMMDKDGQPFMSIISREGGGNLKTFKFTYKNK